MQLAGSWMIVGGLISSDQHLRRNQGLGAPNVAEMQRDIRRLEDALLGTVEAEPVRARASQPPPAPARAIQPPAAEPVETPGERRHNSEAIVTVVTTIVSVPNWQSLPGERINGCIEGSIADCRMLAVAVMANDQMDASVKTHACTLLSLLCEDADSDSCAIHAAAAQRCQATE